MYYPSSFKYGQMPPSAAAIVRDLEFNSTIYSSLAIPTAHRQRRSIPTPGDQARLADYRAAVQDLRRKKISSLLNNFRNPLPASLPSPSATPTPIPAFLEPQVLEIRNRVAGMSLDDVDDGLYRAGLPISLDPKVLRERLIQYEISNLLQSYQAVPDLVCSDPPTTQDREAVTCSAESPSNLEPITPPPIDLSDESVDPEFPPDPVEDRSSPPTNLPSPVPSRPPRSRPVPRKSRFGDVGKIAARVTGKSAEESGKLIAKLVRISQLQKARRLREAALKRGPSYSRVPVKSFVPLPPSPSSDLQAPSAASPPRLCPLSNPTPPDAPRLPTVREVRSVSIKLPEKPPSSPPKNPARVTTQRSSFFEFLETDSDQVESDFESSDPPPSSSSIRSRDSSPQTPSPTPDIPPLMSRLVSCPAPCPEVPALRKFLNPPSPRQRFPVRDGFHHRGGDHSLRGGRFRMNLPPLCPQALPFSQPYYPPPPSLTRPFLASQMWPRYSPVPCWCQGGCFPPPYLPSPHIPY